jgi:serine/threonine protein kinase
MTTIRLCPICASALPADAPSGLCPFCSLKADPDSKPPGQGLQDESNATISISSDAFMPVRSFGDYELQEEIARGGMGVVWKARQASLNRTVALKMILAGKLAGEAEVQRFRREAEAAANLQHPNIVAIHEVGEHDGQHYYSMDYIAGRDLAALVRENGPLPPARAAECVQTLADAVHFAHQRGTLHRDLKPQNVLVDAAGIPRITDFGLAKFVERDDNLTVTGMAMGSPSYMPPEQAAGRLEQVGPASDVYALGAILYELLTGRPPFREDTPMATMRMVMESDPSAPRKHNPTVPPDLENICLKCLEKNPARRYHSARALAEELGRFLKHEPIQARPASTLRKAESWLRRHPWTLMAAASLIAMILTGLLYWQYQRVQFLENPPSLADQAMHPGLRTQELTKWTDYATFVFFTTFLAHLVFRRSVRTKGNWKQFFGRTNDGGPPKPVSQPVRVVCGVIGLGALGVTVLYFAKAIQANVWENRRLDLPLLWVYSTSTLSLRLLLQVVRDYQKFLHGQPGPGLSADQREALCQPIFEGDLPKARKLYRQMTPEAAREEARDFIKDFAAELKARQPDKFAPPPGLWELHWRAMGLGLAIELALLLPISPMMSGKNLLTCGGGFLFGAMTLLATRFKGFWRRVPALSLSCLLVGLAGARFSSGTSYVAGLGFGVVAMACGLKWKRRKAAPAKSS